MMLSGANALELNGDRLLGYVLLWPHVRPWRFTMPQPMLRAIPDVSAVASVLAQACATHEPIEQNLTQIKEGSAQGTKPTDEPTEATNGLGSKGLSDSGLEGAPA